MIEHRRQPDLVVVACASCVEPGSGFLIEAMACKKPVVGPGVGGFRWAGEDEAIVNLGPSNSPSHLADEFQGRRQDAGLLFRAGEAGRRPLESHPTAYTYTDAAPLAHEQVPSKL